MLNQDFDTIVRKIGEQTRKQEEEKKTTKKFENQKFVVLVTSECELLSPQKKIPYKIFFFFFTFFHELVNP